MASYFENFKWVISNNNQFRTDTKSPEKFEFVENIHHVNEENEENNIHKCDETKSSLNQLNKLNSEIKEVLTQYNSVHLEMVEKEQLVRKRLDSDTFDKIKSNYSEYINHDIKIIKDFAVIMETFSHIQEKLNSVESSIKEFESDTRVKNLTPNENNQEYENKIQEIDTKLNNTLNCIKDIKSTNDELIAKIIKLENTINDNEIKGNEILIKLEKIDSLNNKWNISNYLYFDLSNLNNLFSSSNYTNVIIMGLLSGTCIIGTYFGVKYILKK